MKAKAEAEIAEQRRIAQEAEDAEKRAEQEALREEEQAKKDAEDDEQAKALADQIYHERKEKFLLK